MDKFKQTFKDEAYELLGELENALLELEERPDDLELIDSVFRTMHTIKGSAGMFGFDEISAFTHDVETVFDLARAGEISVTKELMDLTLAFKDQVVSMLDASKDGSQIDQKNCDTITLSLRKLIPGIDTMKELGTTSDETSNDSAAKRIMETYWIRFKPPENIFLTGTKLHSLLSELCLLGDSYICAQTDAIPQLQKLDPETCYTWWDIILTTDQGIQAISDVFIFVEDICAININPIDSPGVEVDEIDYKKLGEILVSHGDLSTEDLADVLTKQKHIGELLVDSGKVSSSRVESALAEQRIVRETRTKRKDAAASSSIRVSADKLDNLVDLVGELVMVQARLSQKVSEENDAELVAIAEDVERLITELRETAMGVRMLPIGSIFSRLKRLVRDLSGDLGREILLHTEGGETEVDKTVIERLNDPLVHLIRNSLDHGIEPPEDREKAGKPREGTINLKASHLGSNVVVQIADDGAGLNVDAIKKKAVEKGLITQDAKLSEKDLFGLILQPGFSTAKEVTNVSGRGVGMDVVKRNIEALKGSVEVKSQQGAGTTISIKLPLTLAIIEGLQVVIGDEYFVVPLLSIEGIVELTRKDARDASEQHIINVRGEIMPIIRLRNWFLIKKDLPAIEHVVLVEYDGLKVGLVVDSVIGEHQTVIKSLGQLYKDVKGVSGATVMGDGTVALILDLPTIIQGAHIEEKEVLENLRQKSFEIL